MTVLSTGFLVGLALAEFCVASNVGVDAKLGGVFAMGVRPMSVSITELVAEGRDRSATFRSILASDISDLYRRIGYVSMKTALGSSTKHGVQ